MNCVRLLFFSYLVSAIVTSSNYLVDLSRVNGREIYSGVAHQKVFGCKMLKLEPGETPVDADDQKIKANLILNTK